MASILWHVGKAFQAGFDIIYYACSYVVRSFISFNIIRRVYAQNSLGYLGKFIYLASLRSKLPPRFNTILDIPGIKTGNVRWFSQAHVRERKDPVIFMLHGGGYLFGMTLFHALELKEIWDKLRNDRLSIVWLDYTLSPDARFPKQLEEAMAVYRTLVKSSDNIILLGDSAGGHLALSMCREAYAEKLPKPSSLILVSPWVGLLPETKQLTGSYAKYNNTDAISAQNVHEFGEFAIPLDASIASKVVDLTQFSDWAELLPPANRILVTYGEFEVFRDDIEHFIQVSDVENQGAKVYIEPRGIHDSPVTIGCGFLRLEQNRVVGEIVEFLSQLE